MAASRQLYPRKPTFAWAAISVATVKSRMGAVVCGLWPSLRFPSPLIGRVEDWRAGVGRSLCSPLSRPFVCECHTISTMPRFQPPPRRTQHADFPHCALLFASPQGLWDLSCRGDFRQRSANPVTIEQSQGFVQRIRRVCSLEFRAGGMVSLSVGAGLPSAAPDEARASGHGAGDSCLALSAGGRRGGARR